VVGVVDGKAAERVAEVVVSALPEPGS